MLQERWYATLTALPKGHRDTIMTEIKLAAYGVWKSSGVVRLQIKLVGVTRLTPIDISETWRKRETGTKHHHHSCQWGIVYNVSGTELFAHTYNADD